MATPARIQESYDDRNDVVLRYYDMVERIAHRVAHTYGMPTGMDVEDLVSNGVLGLVEAWERFDESRGVPFESYAVTRVRGAIVDSIRKVDWVPRKVRARARRQAETAALLTNQLGRAPSRAEVAEKLGEDPSRRRSHPVTLLALETTVARDAGGEGSMNVRDTLADHRNEAPGQSLEEAETRRTLLEAINRLPDRDRLILTLYYFEQVQLTDIARVLGVTESRVSQLHMRALGRIRERMEAEQTV